MDIRLAAETEDWLDAQIRLGRFASRAEAIDYSVKLAGLRETLQASVTEPGRRTERGVRSSLKAHFAKRRKSAVSGS